MSCKRIIISELRMRGAVSVPEIAEEFGYSRQAMSSAMSALLRYGAVAELPTNTATSKKYVLGNKEKADRAFATSKRFQEYRYTGEDRDTTFDALTAAWR